MKSIFEEMGGTYTLGTDGMYYPDLKLSEEEPAHYRKSDSVAVGFEHLLIHGLQILPCLPLQVLIQIEAEVGAFDMGAHAVTPFRRRARKASCS